MIMVARSTSDIANLNLLLLCFEEMSGLKINFDKSEVVVLGYSEAEQHRIADNLNCKLAVFPISYLEMPLAESRILVSGFDPLVGRVASRAEPRCGRFTSKGIKTVLISSNLASLPMYMMGMYILPEGVHSAFDKELARFFWQAGDGRPKYHMVKWADICMRKDQGGLGIPASRRMNVALMLRWVWRILQGDGGLWIQLIVAKYLRGRPSWPARSRLGRSSGNLSRASRMIFDWLLRDHLPSGTEVLKRHGPGNGTCLLCHVPETGTHILFSCIAAQALWCFGREALGPEWEAHDLCRLSAALTSLARTRDRDRLQCYLDALMTSARRLSARSHAA
ncbi:retrotransposon unclassified [Hordeum vulgare]|nr:retrotransposon unclassified [Hordeum vulgare]